MLGISVTNTDGSLKNSNQLLNEVADGFVGVKDPADRVRIAMDLFGRSGAGMVNMLQNGSDELQAIRSQFSDLTIELTGAQASAVEEANDRFDALGRTFSSIGHQITALVMPALAKVATFLTVNLLKAIAGTISGFRGLINAFIEGLNVLSSKLGLFDEIQKSSLGKQTEENIRSIVDAYKTLPDAVTPAAEAVQGVATGIQRQETEIQKPKKHLMNTLKLHKTFKLILQMPRLKG